MEQIICYTAYCTLVIISNGNAKKRATNAKCFLAPFFTTRTQCKFALKFIRLSFQRYRFSFGKKCSNFHYILFFINFLQYVQACGVTGEKEHIFDNQKKLNHFQKKRVWCDVDEFFFGYAHSVPCHGFDRSIMCNHSSSNPFSCHHF